MADGVLSNGRELFGQASGYNREYGEFRISSCSVKRRDTIGSTESSELVVLHNIYCTFKKFQKFAVFSCFVVDFSVRIRWRNEWLFR